MDWHVRQVLGPSAAPDQGTRRGEGQGRTLRVQGVIMAVITPSLDSLTLNLNDQVHVRASLEATFDSILAQMGRLNETRDGAPFPMVLEAWPGGRWYRDLGGNNGHLWGHVQAIKRPTLLEIYGPLFMSYAIVNNVQYRLTKVDGGTL